MRIIDTGGQRSEKWYDWHNRPTASGFGRVLTPARGDYSAQATTYAAEVVAKRLGVFTEPPPSDWMKWGIEQEPNAKAAYTAMTGRKITDVDFVLPDGTDAYGCSPDGLVGDDGLLEAKCPKPETLIMYHAEGVLPAVYMPQIQGQLLITGLEWCDFFVFHPGLNPFLLRVEPDEVYQAKLAKCLLKLLKEIELIEKKVRRMDHPIVSLSASLDNLRLGA